MRFLVIVSLELIVCERFFSSCSLIIKSKDRSERDRCEVEVERSATGCTKVLLMFDDDVEASMAVDSHTSV